MFGRLFRRSTPDETFWQWFVAHQHDYLFEQDQARLFDALAEQLKKINPELTFEFGPVVAGKREFVISAGGITSAFPAVTTLVKSAPPLAEWCVIAFIPRSTEKMSIRYRSVSMDPDEVTFAYAAVSGAKIDVVLYSKHFSGRRDDDAHAAAFLLLDRILGEYDVVTKLGGIEFKPLADAPEEALPLAQIVAVVDRHFAKH